MLVDSKNPSLRILIHLPNNPGGKVNYYSAIKEHFKYDTTFFLCGKQGRKESRYGNLRRLLRDFREFYYLIKDGNFDLLVTNPTFDPKSFVRDSIFTLIGCLQGVRTIVFWHGWRWEFERKIASKIKFYFKWTFGRADAMIFLAKEFCDQVRSYGYNKPVYLETTVVGDEISNYERREASIPKPKDHLVILFLSRVEKAKGIYETLDSLIKLRQKYKNLELRVAGEGSELENAKQYVHKNQVKGVKFMGWVKGEKKAQTFHEADIYILPSYSEGMPCSILEAMTCGLPIITTDVGGIKDFFEVGKMGAFVHTRDANDLAQKLDTLLSNPSMMSRMGAYNASFIVGRYTAIDVSTRLEKIFEEVFLTSLNPLLSVEPKT